MKKIGKLGNRGASLVEALISMAIISFVIVSILSGFSQQQMSTRAMSARGVAIQLAEMRLEELLKFPTPQMITETYVDYIVASEKGFKVRNSDPNIQKQYRRTTQIGIDLLGQLATINVIVDFQLTKTSYPFQIKLSTRRGIK